MKKLLAIILFGVPLLVLSQTTPVEFNKHTLEEDASTTGGWSGILDLDKDGDMDMIATFTNEDEFVWYENDGNQNFTKHVIKDQLPRVYSFGAIDINVDGHSDFWVQVSESQEFIILVNDGSQNFSQANIPELDGHAFGRVYDFDGDGDLDIHVKELEWIENLGNLNFDDRIITGIDTTQYQILYRQDFTNDGKVDFLVKDTVNNETNWFENIDSENFTKHSSSFPSEGYYRYGAYDANNPKGHDINQDGFIDLVMYSYDTNEFSWHENDGAQNFTEHVISTSIGAPATDILVEDVDNDNDQDIIVNEFYNKNIVWFENDGSQNFTKHTIYSNFDIPLGQYSMGDIDSDNDTDIFLVGYNSKAVLWFENYLTSTNIDNYVYQTPILGNRNYVYNITPQKAVATLDSIKINSDAIEGVTYIDGLGRPMQQVAMRAGGKGEDLITPITYDDLGRQVKDHLPYATASNTGEKFHSNIENEINTFYKNKYALDFANTVEAEINPYSEKGFEASPLNRVLEQAAPGDSWKIDTQNDTDHTIKFEYQTNSASEVRFFDVIFVDSLNTEAPSLTETEYYDLGELFKTVTKDENWQPGQTHANDHTTEEFKDKQGMVVLKRTYNLNQPHDTYYVYDDYNNLTYVIPPKAADETTINQSILDVLCYQYKYDYRNRLIEKKIPGKGLESIVYDNLDRPVLTQDANLSTLSVWLFTKYDAFGRVIYTGKYTDSTNDRLALQAIFDAKATSDNYEERGSSTLVADYNNVDFPSTNLEILTINYYDNYAPFDSTLDPGSVFNVTTTTETRSLATGSRVKVLDTSDWITTVTYYDDKARPIYVHSQNDFLNTVDIIKNELDFTGRVLKTRTSHINNNTSEPELVTLDTFTYDQMGRVLKQVQCIGGFDLEDDCGAYGADGIENTLVTSETVNPGTSKALEASNVVILKPGFVAKPIAGQTVEVKINAAAGTIVGSQVELIAENTYDELGQLVKKKVGNVESAALQQVDYNYNVRGWLNGINNEDGSNTTITKGATDLFAFQINYDQTASGTALYNGNISQTIWETTSQNNTTNPIATDYTYAYDALNRIESAIDNTGNYSLGSLANPISYDKNGNIQNLSRQGHTTIDGTGKVIGFGVMDDLDYSYDAGNKLISVNELNGASTTFGFKDGVNTATEYTYDVNGNLISDANKGITNINYNHLNLPTAVTINGQNISYIYDATGAKLRKTVNSTTTDYAGNYIYENNNLKQFNHPEGYVEPNGNTFQYVYRYTDIWGNTRITYADDNNDGVITASSEIRREQNYYPFGLEHKGYNNVLSGVKNNLKTYQGQEFTDDLGLNTHEWKFRISDPAIGRFWQIDPLAEDYTYNSTYAFQENKLGLGTELEGKELKRFKKGVKQFFKGVNNLIFNETSGEAQRQIQASKSNGLQKEILKAEGQANRTEAMSDIHDGTIETVKGSPELLEEAGDMISNAGIVSAQPEITAFGEGLAGFGTVLNVGIDLFEGKPVLEILNERLPGILLGELGGKAKKEIKKHVKPGESTDVAESIISAKEKVYEKIIEVVKDKAKEDKD